MSHNVRQFAVFISSMLVFFTLRCFAADQQIVLVVAQDGSQIFYHQNGEPIDSEEIPKGTELTIQSTVGERCFVTYKEKPAYIRRQFLTTKQEFIAAQQKAAQQQVVSPAKTTTFIQQQVAATSTTNAGTKNETRADAIRSVIQNLKARADGAIESGHYHFIGAMLNTYDGDYAEETATERKQLAAEYDEKARIAEASKLEETRRFEAEQTAKGLVNYHEEWISPTERDARVAKEAEEVRQRAEHDQWVEEHKSEIVNDVSAATVKSGETASAAYPEGSEKYEAYLSKLIDRNIVDTCSKYRISREKLSSILMEEGLRDFQKYYGNAQ